MIIILAEIRSFSWFKQEISSEHLEDHTSETPYICRGSIFDPDNNLKKQPVLNLLLLAKPLVIYIVWFGSQWRNDDESSRHCPDQRFLL